MKTESELGPLADYARRLDVVDPAQLSGLDQWFQTTIAAVAAPVPPVSTGLLIMRKIVLFTGLSVPPAIAAGVAVEHSRRAAPSSASVSLSADERAPSWGRWGSAQVQIPRLEPLPGPPPHQASEPRPSTAARAGGRRDRTIVEQDPGGVARRERQKIDLARQLAKQPGQWPAAKRHYVELIATSEDPRLVEVAYRELILELSKSHDPRERRELGARIQAYGERFGEGRYTREFEIIFENSSK